MFPDAEKISMDEGRKRIKTTIPGGDSGYGQLNREKLIFPEG